MRFTLPSSYLKFHSGSIWRQTGHTMYRFYRNNYSPDSFEYCDLTHHNCFPILDNWYKFFAKYLFYFTDDVMLSQSSYCRLCDSRLCPDCHYRRFRWPATLYTDVLWFLRRLSLPWLSCSISPFLSLDHTVQYCNKCYTLSHWTCHYSKHPSNEFRVRWGIPPVPDCNSHCGFNLGL